MPNSLDTSSLINISAIVVSSIFAAVGAIIAWKIPHRSEKIKTAKQARQTHFDRIKNDCLKLLVKGVDNAMTQFYISDSYSYEKDSLKALHNDKELKEISDVKMWISITNQAYGDNLMGLDHLLYEDLDNHYPEVKKEVAIVQKYLDENFPTYYEKRNELVLKLFDVLENAIQPQEKDKKIIGLSIPVALFCIFDYNIKRWPTLYNVSSKNGTLPIIREQIKRPEIIEVGCILREISEKSISLLTNLRNSLERVIRYEGELNGKCTYL